MNAAFNRLSGSSQAQILQLPVGQRYIVMKQIMERSATNKDNDNDNILTGGNNNNNDNDPLGGAFKALPVDKQFVALQGGYTSMAKDFNNLSKKIPDTFTQIIRPISMTEQIAEKYPFFAVGGKNKTSDDKLDGTLDITPDNLPDNPVVGGSNDSTVKNITFT